MFLLFLSKKCPERTSFGALRLLYEEKVVLIVVPGSTFSWHVALGFLSSLNLFCADGIVLPSGKGAADDHEESNEEHCLAEACTVALTLIDDVGFWVLREDVPLDGEAIEANHAVEFGNNEEDDRVDHAVVIGVNADEVRIEAARVRKHAHQVWEHKEEEQECSNELNEPESGVFMLDELVVSLDVSELAIGGREAAKSAEGMDDDERKDESNKYDVHPEMFFAVDECAAGGGDQVVEEVLSELNRARECHVAEEEETEEKAGDGLCDVSICNVAAAALGVLEADAPNVFSSRWGLGVLDGIRGRHDDYSLLINRRYRKKAQTFGYSHPNVSVIMHRIKLNLFENYQIISVNSVYLISTNFGELPKKPLFVGLLKGSLI